MVITVLLAGALTALAVPICVHQIKLYWTSSRTPYQATDFLSALDDFDSSDPSRRARALRILITPRHGGINPQIRLGLYTLQSDEDSYVRFVAVERLLSVTLQLNQDDKRLEDIYFAASEQLVHEPDLQNQESIGFLFKSYALHPRIRLSAKTIERCLPSWRRIAQNAKSKQMKELGSELLREHENSNKD